MNLILCLIIYLYRPQGHICPKRYLVTYKHFFVFNFKYELSRLELGKINVSLYKILGGSLTVVKGLNQSENLNHANPIITIWN